MLERIAVLALWLFVFSVPWEKSVELPGIGTLSKALGAVAFLAGAAAAVHERRLRRAPAALVAAVLFVVWAALTSAWSVHREATFSRAATLAQLLLMFALVWNFTRTPARQAALLQAYVAGAVLAAGATVARYFAGQQTYWKRYATPGFDPNDAGVTMALAVPLALYLGLRVHWAWRVAAIALAPAILLTGSRTAFVATLLGLVFALWTWRRSSWMQRGAAAAVAAVFAGAAMMPAPPRARQRVATVAKEIRTGTLNSRTTIWKAGVKALKQRPLLGAGAGAYPAAVEPFIGKPRVAGHQHVAHNTFLSVLVETGLAGAALFGLLLLALAAYGWAMAGAERALWLTMLLVWAAGVSTLTWEHRKPTWVLIALLASHWALAFRSGEDATR